MKVIYNTTITGIGSMVSEFLREKLLVLFKDNAPDYLAEYSLLHNINDLRDSIEIGDDLVIDNIRYPITAVGEEVGRNLRLLGHITLRFDGSAPPVLPGTLALEDREVPGIEVGSIIQIVR